MAAMSRTIGEAVISESVDVSLIVADKSFPEFSYNANS